MGIEGCRLRGTQAGADFADVQRLIRIGPDTGRKLRPSEGNIDHIVPRSRGGKTSWENCVLADKRINSRKGNRLPEEIGLRLLRPPFAPREVPTSALIRNHYSVRDWEHFIGKVESDRVQMV